MILVRIQPGRGELRGVVASVGIRPLPTQARARLAPCGEPIACEHIDLVGNVGNSLAVALVGNVGNLF